MLPVVSKEQANDAAQELLAMFRDGRAKKEYINVALGTLWLVIFFGQKAADGKPVYGADYGHDNAVLNQLAMALEHLAYEIDPGYKIPVGFHGNLVIDTLAKQVIEMLKNYIATNGWTSILSMILSQLILS